MFGRTGKIRKAVERSVKAALAGEDDAFAPIEGLRDSEKVDAYIDVCETLIFEEDLEAADRAADRALALAPDELYVQHAKAEVAMEAGRLADAVAIYEQMYQQAPDDPAVITGLASLHLSNQTPAAAVEILEPHADSQNPALQLRLGEALFAADRAEDALVVLDRVHDHYRSALERATFVDNPEELQARLGHAARLRDEVYAELYGPEGTDANPAAPAPTEPEAGDDSPEAPRDDE